MNYWKRKKGVDASNNGRMTGKTFYQILKSKKMQNEVVETVLNEVLAEQKEVAVQIENLQKNISLMTSRFEQFDQKLDNLKVTAPSVDLSSTRLFVGAALEDVKKVVAEQPKQVVQQKRYLLFPEHNAREYYEAVFKWLFFMMMGTFAFYLIKELLDRWK